MIAASHHSSPSLPARIGIALIRCYQVCLSQFKPRVCRFYPSCSEYAVRALAHCGLVRGSWLALRRLLRCHPFHPGGFDPGPWAKDDSEGGAA